MQKINEKIVKLTSRLKIEASSEQIKLLADYSNHIIETNSVTNLTGAKRVEDFIEGPLFDAMTIIPSLEESKNIVDVGSGGGLPAFPMAVFFPNMHITMVEPRKKRFEFLKDLSEKFSLNTTVLQTQDRELPKNSFDGATAQAVFPPEKWIKRAVQLIKKGGLVYILSSSEVSKNILPKRCSIVKTHRFESTISENSRFSTAIKFD